MIKVAYLGGSNLNLLRDHLDDDLKPQIVLNRTSTISLMTPALNRGNSSNVNKKASQFIENELNKKHSQRFLSAIDAREIDVIIIDVIRDVVQRVVRCGESVITIPPKWMAGSDFLETLGNYQELIFSTPEYGELWKASVDKLMCQHIEPFFSSGRPVIIVKFKMPVCLISPSKIEHSSQELMEARIFNVYLRGYYKYLEQKFPFITFIEDEQFLNFNTYLSMIPYDLIHSCDPYYHDMALKIKKFLLNKNSVQIKRAAFENIDIMFHYLTSATIAAEQTAKVDDFGKMKTHTPNT